MQDVQAPAMSVFDWIVISNYTSAQIFIYTQLFGCSCSAFIVSCTGTSTRDILYTHVCSNSNTHISKTCTEMYTQTQIHWILGAAVVTRVIQRSAPKWYTRMHRKTQYTCSGTLQLWRHAFGSAARRCIHLCTETKNTNRLTLGSSCGDTLGSAVCCRCVLLVLPHACGRFNISECRIGSYVSKLAFQGLT